jgi:hypothetical protein
LLMLLTLVQPVDDAFAVEVPSVRRKTSDKD